ncbi:MAG: hypothetical protein GXO82_08985 [Chlorobi bacterium]|nr:hypothetical protein [Chlorobiota bacterium]
MKETNSIDAELRDLVHRIIESHSAIVMEIVVKGSKRSPVLQVFVDTEDGITLKELAGFHRELNASIEQAGLLGRSYRVEVSSPGATRPLRFDWQYRRNVGRDLEITTRAGETMRGTLRDVNSDGVMLEYKNANQFIKFEDIETAHVQLRF